MSPNLLIHIGEALATMFVQWVYKQNMSEEDKFQVLAKTSRAIYDEKARTKWAKP